MASQEITYSKLEEILAFAVKGSAEIVRNENPCSEFGLKLEEKVMQKYDFPELLNSRICRSVFWYLTLGKDALLPSDGAVKWQATEKAKNLDDNEIKGITKEILKEYKVYIESNFRNFNYVLR